MKKKLRENLALVLFVLLVFCFAHAVNSSSPSTRITAACSTVSCSQPGCGFDPFLFVENADASKVQQLNH